MISYPVAGLSLLLLMSQVALVSKAEVRAVIEAEYPGARVTEVERETYRGEKIFEVDFRHEGRKLEAIVSLQGEIIRVHVDD